MRRIQRHQVSSEPSSSAGCDSSPGDGGPAPREHLRAGVRGKIAEDVAVVAAVAAAVDALLANEVGKRKADALTPVSRVGGSCRNHH